MSQTTYINKRAMSFNEGGRWFNFHIRWKGRFFVYIYILGFRAYGGVE